VTVTFRATEAVTAPTFSIGGGAPTTAASTSDGGVTWTAARTVSSGIGEGAVAVSVSSYADLAGNAGATASDASSVFVVGSPASLAFVTQPDGALGGASFTQQPVVRALDAGGAVSVSFSGTVAIAKLSGPGTLSGALTADAVAGVATFAGLSIDTVGDYVLRASISSPSALSVDSAQFTVSAGPAVSLAFSTQPDGSAVGEPLSSQPVVRAVDAGNNLVADALLVTLEVASGPATATLSASSLGVALSAGSAAFAGVGLDEAGTFTLRASTSSPALSVTSSPFTLAAGAAAARARLYHSLVIEWEPTGAQAGDTLLGYTVDVAASAAGLDSAVLQSLSAAPTATRLEIVDLQPGTEYWTRVTATFASAPAVVYPAQASSTADPFATESSPAGAFAAAKAALDAATGQLSLAQSATALSGAPCALDLCADGWRDAGSCGSHGGPGETLGGAGFSRTGYCGVAALGQNLEDFSAAAFSAAFAADAGVAASRVRVNTANTGSIVVDYTLTPDLAAGCAPLAEGEAPPAIELNEALSELEAGSGDLVLTFDSTAHFTSVAFTFEDPGTGVDDAACHTDAGVWTATDRPGADCGVRHTFRLPLTTALAKCGFAADSSGEPAASRYAATVRISTVRDGPDVFGQATRRRDETAVTLQVEIPSEASVSSEGGADVFGSAINLAAAVEQTWDTTLRRARVELATSNQWPYALASPTVVGDTTDKFTATAEPAALSRSASCDDSASGSGCAQRWAVTVSPDASCAAGTTRLEGSYTVRFSVECSGSFAGSCDVPAPGYVDVVFSLASDDYCPRVAEVASVTPSLALYADPSSRESQTSATVDFVASSMAYGRVQLQVEGGVAVSRVSLDALDIVSQCSPCDTPRVVALADGGSGAVTGDPAADFDFGYETGGRADGQPRHDFEFRVNTASVSFDGDATTGQGTVVVVATVVVEYAAPSGQARRGRFRVAAASGPGSLSSTATTAFAASSPSPAAPASPSSGAASSSAALMARRGSPLAGRSLRARSPLSALRPQRWCGAAAVARRHVRRTSKRGPSKRHAAHAAIIDTQPATVSRRAAWSRAVVRHVAES
jgi:hypothetical protein